MIVRLTSLVLLFAWMLLPATRQPVRARHGMVVSVEKHATEIGVEVLRKGGNAVDAAVAVGFALSVTHPQAGSLGGGGFMLIRFADGRSTFLDFRERAPGKATRTMYLDANGKPTDASVVGYRASGVPGSVRGYALALEKYGTWRLRRVLEPAIELATDGFMVTYQFAKELRETERLSRFAESKRVFLRDGNFLEQGDVLKQPDLANTLKRISKNGADELYTGETARKIAADMESNGGLIALDDLSSYKAVERQPVKGEYRGYEILTAPPPSSASGVIQMLNMLEGSGYEKTGAGSAASIHYAAETMRRFFADRAEYFGDSDFVDVPLTKLLSKDYALARRATIDPERISASKDIQAGPAAAGESGETTHFSVVDSQGNAVAVTYTINGWYGSGVTVKGTGIVMNNEMDDFTAKPGEPNMYGLVQSSRNAIEPNKRPLSAMSPTILSRDGKLALVLGSPGGPTIINTVLQVITNVIDYGMNLQQAVDFPRFHHQWMPDELRMESYGFSPDTLELLRKRGHKLTFIEAIGRVMAIQVDQGWLLGADDSRTEGLAAGY